MYLAVLELGQSPAGPIVKKCLMHRQQVYDNLNKLREKQLISETIKSNRKNWMASHPEEIIRQIKEKHSLAESILPTLLSTYKLSSHKQEVRVFEGIEGFKAVHKINITHQPKNTIVPVMGANGWNWVEIMKDAHYLKQYEKLRVEKNIAHHLVFFEKERKGTEELIEKHFGSNPLERKRVYKFLPDEFQSPVGMQIWHDNITLIIYSNPVVVIQIINTLVVKNFQKYFDFLWKVANK